ncbi:MAG: MaoC family dehydratase N-terminal domain-containing protein [Chloroflexi bacterium]|nr:MaoC family dehydratase N-terminal domain-containing protein [Chloroflexota bacterium]
MLTPGRTVTETDIVNFAGVSGDYNPLHVDAEFAKGSQFGQRVAHGLLGLALASGLASQLGFINAVQAFLSVDWKFKAPIYIGDTVKVLVQIKQTKPLSRLGGGIVVLGLTITNQNGEKVQEGEWSVLIKSRSVE